MLDELWEYEDYSIEEIVSGASAELGKEFLQKRFAEYRDDYVDDTFKALEADYDDEPYIIKRYASFIKYGSYENEEIILYVV
ncbi:MAG: hypothetical protein K6G26_03655 [Lachnospiraceae bacterium]|nr:hypothetical protein [Lachnospiraceae bacterium]